MPDRKKIFSLMYIPICICIVKSMTTTSHEEEKHRTKEFGSRKYLCRSSPSNTNSIYTSTKSPSHSVNVRILIFRMSGEGMGCQWTRWRICKRIWECLWRVWRVCEVGKRSVEWSSGRFYEAKCSLWFDLCPEDWRHNTCHTVMLSHAEFMPIYNAAA